MLPRVNLAEWNSFLLSDVFTCVVSLRDDADALSDRLGCDWVITRYHYHLYTTTHRQTDRQTDRQTNTTPQPRRVKHTDIQSHTQSSLHHKYIHARERLIDYLIHHTVGEHQPSPPFLHSPFSFLPVMSVSLSTLFPSFLPPHFHPFFFFLILPSFISP